jgi:pSer/pThr/pTyr-binding forkhead associated (FHA) protein
MRIELRILSGARAGQSEVFEKSTILVGRKPSNDLRFDLRGDLDVSGEHGQIREQAGQWFIVDNGSTNGTYVNGEQVRDEAPIKDGDIIAFGRNGPTVEVRAKGDATGKTPAVPRTDARRAAKTPIETPRRMSTHERVAIAVNQQTRPMKVMLLASMIGLGAIAVVAYWFGTREGRNQVAQMQRLLAQAESTSTALRERASTGDTTLAKTLQRQMDSLRAQAREAANGTDQQIAAATQAIEQHTFRQQNLVKMDMVAITAANDRAVAFLITEIDGEAKGGTAFGVTNGGLMITNRHNVRSEATRTMTKNLSVIFSGSSARLRARVVRVFDDVDLALIQVENEGTYPTVQGISANGDVAVGAAAAIIGFPLSLGLPMDGDKMTSTLTPGTVSKRIPTLLQLDAYGAHGMSGSPVFDSRGLVVGVVYGGPKDAPQIIYAVPSDRVAAALGEVAKGIVR